MKMLKGKRKGKLWLGGAEVVALFTVLFIVLFSVRGGREIHAAGYTFSTNGITAASGGTLPMRGSTQTFNLEGLPSNMKAEWTVPSEAQTIVDLTDISVNKDGRNISLTLKPGATFPDQGITLSVLVPELTANGDPIQDDQGQWVTYTLSLTVTLPFTINEYLNGSAPNGSRFRRVFTGENGDERNSLILYYGTGSSDANVKPDVGTTLIIGTDSTDSAQANRLNLLLRNAQDAVWTSDDPTVVDVGLDSSGKPQCIQAIGAGHAKLTATLGSESDTIDVYVCPSIYKDDGVDKTFVGGYGASGSTTIKNNDILQVTIGKGGQGGFSDRLAWVITRFDANGNEIFVKDSLGNVGDPSSYPDDINLGTPTSDGEMRVYAKAGQYSIHFFVGGTYKDYDTSYNTTTHTATNPPSSETITSVALTAASAYESKQVSVGVGGSYDLCEALNISRSVFESNFDAQILNEANLPVWLQQQGITPLDPATNGENYLEAGNRAGSILNAKYNLGTARVLVRARDPLSNPNIPKADANGNIGSGDWILLTIKVIDTFSLNVTNATMAVGSTLNLTGLIGSGAHAEPSQFKWTWDSRYVDLDADTGQRVTVTAKTRTPNGQDTRVTLSWTDTDGVTWVSTCNLVITDADPNFTIDPPAYSMEVGETFDLNLKTTLSGDQPNIIWFTADETICTVEALQGNLAARITAGNRTGQTIITAFNKENNAYATCVVTVTSPITAIKIDKGEEYRLNSTTAFAFLKAIYEPSDATETELKWSVKSVQGTDVVSLEADEEDATLTIKKAGIVDVTVEPVNNPNGVSASCRVIIEDMPITGIKTDVTKLDMVKGDKYEVKVDLTPATPTDSTLTWSSDDTKVATVDNKGVITAAGVGTTIIKVNGGTAPTQTIIVNVREKLQSIAFEHPSETITIKEKKTLNVIFTPNTDVKKDLTFRSTDEKVVTVNAATGEITGVGEGMAMIIASSEELGTAGTITCIIIVTPEEFTVEDFNIDPEEITIQQEESFEIISSFTPEDATDQRVAYVSFNSDIAEVDENGIVTGHAIGDTYIQCTSLGSGISRFCHVIVESSEIVVEDFDISPAEQSIHVDESFDIIPSFTPEDAENKEVEYISFDPDVASVDSDGKVTGLTVGDTYIQCTSVASGISRFCHVIVDTAVTLKISPTSREIALGKSFKITKTVSPDASDTTATWKSSDKKIAAVNQNGRVTGKKIGSCIITCTLDKYGVSATCRVKVAKLRTTLTLDKKSIRLNVGQSYKLKKTVWSNNTNMKPAVKFTSKNKRIATVGSGGKVTGKKVGSTIVTAKSADAVKATAKCRVTVIHRSTGIRLNKTYSLCYIGSTIKLKATVLPKTSTVKTVKWSSSNPEIADVLSNGKVTGYAEGEVYITATTTDGSNKSAKCLVKVVEPIPVTDILVAQSKITLRRGDTDNLAVTLLPDNTSDSIKMASDNKKVATVTNSGRVTAVGTGTATITITATGGVTSTVTVEVVDLNKTSVTMRQYDTETLQVLGTGDTITWYSADNRVATVANGLVTAKSIGQTTIYAYVNGCRISCAVRVVSVNAQR